MGDEITAENAGRSGRRQLTAVDLFAGAGGMSRGLTEAGFRVIAAAERDVQAFQTYRLNHGGTGQLLQRDVRELAPADLLGARRRRRLDLVAGGPPCQGFSIKGERRADHPGNKMLMEFVRLIAELRPRAVLLENVPGLLTLAGGYYFDRLVTGLERIRLADGGRYDVEFAILNAAEFGVPQLRRRLFVVAVEPGRRWQWPPVVSAPGDITLWDAIADLPEHVHGDGPPPYAGPPVSAYASSLRRGSTVLNHHTKRLEELRLRRLAALEPGQDSRHLPEELQAGGHETKYRRLRPAQPCPTVTAHMGKDMSDFIHPYLHRTLTVREAARIQGFPDDYEFVGSLASQFTQVGNAVPVPLARELGRELVATLKRRKASPAGVAEDRRQLA